jgi:hypothetical protein
MKNENENKKITIVKEKNGKRYYFEIFPDETKVENMDFITPVHYKNKTVQAHYNLDGVVRFYSTEIIDGQKINGLKVEGIEKQKLDNLFKEKEQEREKQKEEIRHYIPKKIQYKQGDETGHIYISTDEIEDTELKEKCEILKEIETLMNEYWREFSLREVVKQSKKLDEIYYEIETEKLLSLLKPAIEAKEKEDAEREERRRKKEEERKRIFEKAKETGEPQLIGRYPIFVNDDPENDVDIVSVWAMPDGTVKEERIHTY